MRPRRWTPAALLVVGLVGCGSTVGQTAGSTSGVGGGAGGPGGAGLAAPSGSGASTTTPGSAVGSSPGEAALGGGTAGGADTGQAVGAPGAVSGTSVPTSTGSSVGRSGVVPANAPGVTATTVYIGLGYSSQEAGGDKAIGASGAAPSYDMRSVYNAYISYANAHGGFAGRHLVPLYYDYNLTTDQSTQDQSACAYWTQDHKVFVMDASSDVLRACAEKAGAIAIGNGGDVLSTFQRFPHYVDPDTIRLDRLGPATVSGLFRAGYFTGKLGLVTWDEPNYRFTMQQGYLPALASHGIKPTDVAYVTVPQQVGALGDMSAAVQSAVTKFHSEGIDHVIIQDGPAGVWAGTGLTLEWMDQAKSQGWYPRYGANAENSPGASILPSDEQDKELAIFDADVDPSYDQGWHPNSAREACYKIQADAGQPVSTSNVSDEDIAAFTCDDVFFPQRVLNAVSAVSTDAFMQAVSGLGTSWPAAFVYGTNFFAGRRDGSDAFRQAEYFSSCTCLKFSGPPAYVG